MSASRRDQEPAGPTSQLAQREPHAKPPSEGGCHRVDGIDADHARTRRARPGSARPSTMRPLVATRRAGRRDRERRARPGRGRARGARCPTTSPPTITTTTCTSSTRARGAIRGPADAAWSRVSEAAFCTVRMRKKKPVTSVTTRNARKRMMAKDCETGCTPGDATTAAPVEGLHAGHRPVIAGRECRRASPRLSGATAMAEGNIGRSAPSGFATRRAASKVG